jgi:hypothetical protein
MKVKAEVKEEINTIQFYYDTGKSGLFKLVGETERKVLILGTNSIRQPERVFVITGFGLQQVAGLESWLREKVIPTSGKVTFEF